MSSPYQGGKGDRRRPSTPTDKQAKVVCCSWCPYYLMIKKKCMKPDNVKCPKE